MPDVPPAAGLLEQDMISSNDPEGTGCGQWLGGRGSGTASEGDRRSRSTERSCQDLFLVGELTEREKRRRREAMKEAVKSAGATAAEVALNNRGG